MRWRVRDNLPGKREYCPLVRRDAQIKAAEQYDIAGKLALLEADFGIDLIQRSTVWLTIKESRASFLIEHEQNQEDRDLTAHVGYLAGVIDDTITQEMRTEARFLQSNEQARSAIKQFLEAPDHDLDGIIRSVRQNGNVVSNQIKKRYPLLQDKPELVDAIQVAVVRAFGE